MVAHDPENARMKVTGPSAPASSAGRASAPAAGGFALSQSAGAAPASAAATTSAMGGVSGMSALMALQGVEDVTERRRRAIRRGTGLLDRLDELKLSLLSGETGEGALISLSRTLREARTDEDEPGLNAVLDQIDLRAAVELAKAEVRRSAA